MTTLALAEVRFRQFLSLAKPRVVSLIVFVAISVAPRGAGPASVVPFVFGTGGIARRQCGRGHQLPGQRKVDALMARSAPAAYW
jgi:heme O synthase-like polyprenyltransferase